MFKPFGLYVLAGPAARAAGSTVIQQLYDIERGVAKLTPDAQQARRQKQSVSLLAQIDAERTRLASIVLPKSPVSDGLRYLTNQWTALQRFVDDGWA